MSSVTITYMVEDEEAERLLGASEDNYEIELEVHFYYEPADPSVGIPREAFCIEEVVKANGRRIEESEVGGRIWQQIEDLFDQKIEYEREQAEIEYQLNKRGL